MLPRFANECLNCGVPLTTENTYPPRANRVWRRCKDCLNHKRNKTQKLCLWCGTILTESNTYKGGPSQHSYCKPHYSSTGRLKDFASRVPIEETRPNLYNKIKHCTSCGTELTRENRARTKAIKLCAGCYQMEQAQAEIQVHCLFCNTLLTDETRDPTASRLYPYCKLHLTFQQRRQAQSEQEARHKSAQVSSSQALTGKGAVQGRCVAVALC
jgi:hypothetical protein